MNSQIT